MENKSFFHAQVYRSSSNPINPQSCIQWTFDVVGQEKDDVWGFSGEMVCVLTFYPGDSNSVFIM